MVSMDTGLRHDLMGARGVDLLSRNINNIVGNLWQRQETDLTTPNTNTSTSSNGNMSPGSGESGPESPHHKIDDRRLGGDEDGSGRNSSGDIQLTDEAGRPSIGIRSDLLPHLSKEGGLGDITGLPALEALRRQAGYQNPFLSSMSSPITSGSGLTLTTKRPSQPPTPQSSTSGGDPSSAWSFEEQFKQLYEIDDNPKRKQFLDDVFSFMQKRGTPINRLPIMAKQVLDLYELYNLVVSRGGLVEVINKKQWQEIIKGLGLPSSITSAAFTLRTQYTKYLYPWEASQFNFSNNSDLQNAIDGNKREGRRLGPYDMAGSPMGGMGGFTRFPHSPTHSPPHPNLGHPGMPGSMGADPLAQLEMTRLALWKLYAQGQTPPPPPHLLGLPNPASMEIELRRKEQERLIEEHKEQMQQNEDDRRREEARRRITDDAIMMEPAEKRLRRDEAMEERDGGVVVEDEEEEMEEPELEVTRRKQPSSAAGHANTTTISLNSSGDTEDGGKSMKISLEVNGIIYSGVLYAKPS